MMLMSLFLPQPITFIMSIISIGTCCNGRVRGPALMVRSKRLGT